MTKIKECSIIIPTYNRCKTLRKNLECLEKQTYPLEFMEIIIVDDHSTDATWEMLNKYKGPLKLKFDKNPKGSPDKYGYISSLNHGLNLATKELCIFLDSDLLPEKRLVEEHVKTHNKWLSKGEHVVCRGWRTEEYSIDEIENYNLEEDAEYNWQLLYYIENKDNIAPQMCIGNNFSVLREDVIKVGGFGEDEYRYGQDRRVPYKCKHLLNMRIVANVYAYGSHIPLEKDQPSPRKKSKKSKEKKEIDKIICLLELTNAYLLLEEKDKALDTLEKIRDKIPILNIGESEIELSLMQFFLSIKNTNVDEEFVIKYIKLFEKYLEDINVLFQIAHLFIRNKNLKDGVYYMEKLFYKYRDKKQFINTNVLRESVYFLITYYLNSSTPQKASEFIRFFLSYYPMDERCKKLKNQKEI